jgi:hypothetical protein
VILKKNIEHVFTKTSQLACIVTIPKTSVLQWMSSCTIASEIGIHGKTMNGLLGLKQTLLIGELTSGGANQISMHTSVTIQQLKIAGTPAKIFLETCSLVLTFG